MHAAVDTRGRAVFIDEDGAMMLLYRSTKIAHRSPPEAHDSERPQIPGT